jgi:RNA polymerase sigma-70 factor (ECF subfamily)
MKARYQAYSDAKLTELLILRDNRAFEEIYNRYWGQLYNFCRKMLQNDHQAEDLIQEAFTNLYARKEQLYQQTSIRAYLYRSVRNQIIDQVRHQKVKGDYISSLKEYINRGEWITDNLVRENELERQIQKAIDELPPKMRTVFEMSRKKYYSYRQIAEATGTSEETVRKQMSNVLKKLRSKLTMFILFQLMLAILWLNKPTDTEIRAITTLTVC